MNKMNIKDFLVGILGNYDEQVLRFAILGALMGVVTKRNERVIERIITFFTSVVTSFAISAFIADFLGYEKSVTFFAFCIGYLGLRGLEKLIDKINLENVFYKFLKEKLDDNGDDIDDEPEDGNNAL